MKISAGSNRCRWKTARRCCCWELHIHRTPSRRPWPRPSMTGSRNFRTYLAVCCVPFITHTACYHNRYHSGIFLMQLYYGLSTRVVAKIVCTTLSPVCTYLRTSHACTEDTDNYHGVPLIQISNEIMATDIWLGLLTGPNSRRFSLPALRNRNTSLLRQLRATVPRFPGMVSSIFTDTYHNTMQ